MPSTNGVVEQRCTLPELLPMSGVRRPSTCTDVSSSEKQLNIQKRKTNTNINDKKNQTQIL